MRDVNDLKQLLGPKGADYTDEQLQKLSKDVDAILNLFLDSLHRTKARQATSNNRVSNDTVIHIDDSLKGSYDRYAHGFDQSH